VALGSETLDLRSEPSAVAAGGLGSTLLILHSVGAHGELEDFAATIDLPDQIRSP